MKKITKKVLAVVALLTVFSFGVIAQTNVSGGIFANTTWTLANSPYTITDTVVVFPNVTLTIQPGVVVKFADSTIIEMRQAKLVAVGTPTDSITFRSNSSSPFAGIHNGIFLNGGNYSSKFSYCKISDATFGIYSTSADSIYIHHSFFNHNLIGFEFNGNHGTNQVSLIDSTTFLYNDNIGVYLYHIKSLGVNHCIFSHNGTGLIGGSQTKKCVFTFNQTGLTGGGYVDSCTFVHNQTGSGGNSIHNSIIDSNSVYGIDSYADSIINCTITHNGIGVRSFEAVIKGNIIEYNNTANISISSGSSTTTIKENFIRYSNVGIDNIVSTVNFSITDNLIENNNIGINLNSSTGIISCNRLCNNTSFDLKYGASNNLNASHNFWCTNDSASTQALIYDGHNNINYGLVNFMPLDSACAPPGITTGISPNKVPDFSFKIFPNPASDNLTLELPETISKAEIRITNILGEVEFFMKRAAQKTNINVSGLANGIYFIQVTSGKNIGRLQFVKQ